MMRIYFKNKRQERTDLVKNNGKWGVFILYGLLIVLASGCAAGKNLQVEEEEKIKKENIDYTLYDLKFVEGIKQKLGGDFGEALNKFEEALEINPWSDAANYEISQIAVMRRDYDNALVYARSAAELDSENPWYMMNMANIYMQESQVDSACIWLEKAVRIDPANVNERFRLGNLYMQAGNNEKAEKVFQEFYDKYGDNKQVLALLINTKMNLGKYAEAEKILLNEIGEDRQNTTAEGMLAEIYRKSGESEKAAIMYEKIINEGQYDAGLTFSYLEFLIENKKYKELKKRAVEVIDKEDITKEDKASIVIRLLQDSAVVNKLKEELIEIGRNLMLSYKDDATIVLTMAEIYGSVGEKEKEIATLIEYIDKHEENYFIWENLLLSLNEANDTDRLYNYAGRASRLFNTAPLPKILYAYSLIEKENYEMAKDELRKVRILVNNEEQYLEQILALEAEISYRKGNIDEASKKFDSALEINPENPLILNNYAYYLAEEGIRLDEARKMIERCLKIEENITYLDTYAWVLYKLGKYKDAEKVMSRIFASEVIKDAELLEHYGYIKKALGNNEEAVALLQAALAEDKTKTYLIEEIRKCIEKE